MRALVTRRRDDGVREKVLVTDWPDPGPPSGNLVRTKTFFSGITNGTEANDLVGGNYARPDERLPAGFGYQNVGRVIEVGPDVRELKVGQILFMSRDHMEFCLLPEDGLCIRLLDHVDKTHAALFGMASVAMRACRRANLRMGDRLLIVGAGFIGQIAAQIAAATAVRVTLSDLDEHRLAIARRIGAAEEVFNVEGEGWQRHIKDGTFEAVLDVAGAAGMENRLIPAVTHEGAVILVAGRFNVEYNHMIGQRVEVTIKQTGHFTNLDLANVCRLVARGVVQIAPLLRAVVPVWEADAIYNTLRDKPNQLLGTVFDWRSPPKC